MDEPNIDYYHEKIFCAEQYAMSRYGANFYFGGLEHTWHELYLLFLHRQLNPYKTLSYSAQYHVKKSTHGIRALDQTVIPDFAILRSIVDTINGQWSFDTRMVLAVIELKPIDFNLPPGATHKEFRKASEKTFRFVLMQAKKQAKYVFANNSSQMYVFALQCVGPFWNYTIYVRDGTSPLKPAEDPDGAYIDNHAILRVYRHPSQPVKVGTAASDKAFEEMLGKMKSRFGAPPLVNGTPVPW